jgi:hypothetical protein
MQNVAILSQNEQILVSIKELISQFIGWDTQQVSSQYLLDVKYFDNHMLFENLSQIQWSLVT